MRVSAWFIVGLGCLFLFGFFVLGVSLYRLQAEKAGEFAEEETTQTTRRISVPALRGRILDRSGRVLADCRPSRCVVCNLEELQQRGGRSNTVNAIDAAVDALAAAIGTPRVLTREQIARHVARASALPLTVWRDLDETTFARFAERADAFPGFDMAVRAERRYPYGTLAAHVIGYTGRGRPGEDAALPTGTHGAHFFEELEMKGRKGVEGYYNRYLAGFPGERFLRVDARGFRPRKSAGQELADAAADDIVPADGLDLELTLDIDVQEELERQLEGVTGAGVVLDPRDGAVLAMASSPTFNPNDCIPHLSASVYASLTNAPAKRGQNRAISEAYAPGSTFKPVTALAALATGWLPDDEYDCIGVYQLGPWKLRCWDYYGHGPINLRQALEQSCNTFFCNIGSAIGTNALIEAARAFGLGACTGIDLGEETPGVVPDEAWKKFHYNEPWYPGDTCQMSIGQGMLLVTPLQMAVVAATLANGGTRVRPYLHKKDGNPDGKKRPAGPVLPFSRESIDLVREGMRDVVIGGTGRKIATGLPVTCAGKTGTAEIGRGETRRKNTWVIAFAPYENPTAAIAMVVERGESGGKTVAPRVNAVLARMFGRTQEGGAP